MLGTLRFTLAVLVVFNHLWIPTSNKLGAHAVAGFYIVSGFLMTKVIQEVYGLSAVGFRHFLFNRFLRIFPAYWCFLALSVALIVAFPSTFPIYSLMRLPDDSFDLFRNVTLVYLTRSPTIVIPPAWSLWVEWAFYLAMAAVLSRRKITVQLWFLTSLVIQVYLVATGASFSDRYYPTYAASLFFATGALLYFHLDFARRFVLHKTVLPVALAIFCVAPLITEGVGLDRSMTGYYGATLLFVPIFLSFLLLRPAAWRPADSLLGDLAYLVFITHFFAGGLVHTLAPNAVTPYGFAFLCLGLVTSVGLSLAFLIVVQRRIDRWRDRIRSPKLDVQTAVPPALSRGASVAGP